MEASLKDFGLKYEDFIKNQEITKSFYKDLASLYNLADLNQEIKNSYGREAIRAFYNGDKNFIDKIISEQAGLENQAAERIAKTLTDPQKAYLISEKFIDDVKNLREVFPSELVENANFFMDDPYGIYKAFEPIKYKDFINGLEKIPELDLSHKQFENLKSGLSNIDSLESGKIKYKFENPNKKTGFDLSLQSLKKSQAKFNINNIRNFELNGTKYKRARKISAYTSIDKIFGIELSDKKSNETLGVSSTKKFGYNFKEKFYIGHSYSSKLVDTDFKLSGKDVSIESKAAVTKNVKAGFELQMDHDDTSIIPNYHIKSEIDLKNANMGDLIVYSIIKPIEVSHNLMMDYMKSSIDKALGDEKVEEENTEISLVEEYADELEKRGELDKLLEEEVEKSLNQIIDSELLDEVSQEVFEAEYQEFINQEVQKAEEALQEEMDQQIQEEITVENIQGFGL